MLPCWLLPFDQSPNGYIFAGIEALVVMSMKITVFWGVMQCILENVR